MADLAQKIRHSLTQPILPHAAFQVSSHYLSGMFVSGAERKIKERFILPLKEGVIEPSFSKKNVLDEAFLVEKVRQGAEKLHLSKKSIACLIPEPCSKISVLNFDSFPSSHKEREGIIRWQLKKKMPFLPPDTRLSYASIESNAKVKILVSGARTAVVKEYEDSFAKAGLRARLVTTPTLSLYNLFEKEDRGDSIVVNIEEESISLMVIVNGEISLYRAKPFVHHRTDKPHLSQKIEYVVTELENTINFIHDKEGKKIDSLWIRVALIDPEGEVFSRLKERLVLPLKGMDSFLPSDLSSRERQILAPLAGSIVKL
ncbi:MAG: type IV pilus biogenesis protein PilM [Candidatus Aminicenantales bacterium]